MPNIIDILARALSLRQETALNSITPNRAGGIMYDTLLVLNQMQLEGGSLLISKVYASVSAMEADTTPTSDLTGRALKPGQLVVIVTSDSSSSDMGSEYRFNGPGSWTYVGKVGGLPLDTVPTQSSTKGITSGGVYTALAAMKAEGYKYMGLATPGSGGTAPGTPNQPVFYIAGPGSYPNFGSITVASGYLGFIKYSGGSWSVESVAVGKDYDEEISQLDGKIKDVALDLNTDVKGKYEERHFKTEADGVSIIQDFDTPANNFILRVNENVGSTTKYLLQMLDTGGTASNYQTDNQFDTDLQVTIDKATYPKMRVYAGSSYGTPTYTQEQTDFLLQVKTITPGVRELAERGDSHINEMEGTHIKKEFAATQGSSISLARTTFGVDFSIGDIIKVSLITDCVADVALYYRQKGSGSLSQDGSLTANANPRYIKLTKNIDQIAIYRSGGSVTQSGVVQLLIDKVGELDRANPLRGKRVVMFGDSITQLPCTGNTRGLGIPEFFEEMTGAKVFRLAIGGTKLTRSVAELPESVTDAASASACYQICSLIEGAVSGNTTRQAAAINGYISDSFTKDVTLPILQNIDLDDIDIVTIFGGTNDCSSGISLGQKTDTDPTTIYGAVNYITKILLQRNPKLKVFFFTPIVRFFAEDNVSSWSDEYTPNQAGLYLYEYAEQIVESAVANHIRVCDLYNGMGWTKYNFVNFCSATDWTHPRAGFDVIAEKMANFIKSNL